MRVGIVLAAGESSRNPNKLLLPTAHGIASARLGSGASLPMFLQAAEWCFWHQGCDSVVVVLREGSAVDLWLQAYGYKPSWLRRVYQQSDGIMGALHVGLQHTAGANQVLVAFGDNVYDSCERVAHNVEGQNCASVRVLGGERARGLDYWNSGGYWCDSRKNFALAPQRCFAGWLLLSSGCTEILPGMVGLLNAANVRPVLVSNTYMWHDVGTPEGYARYLKDCTLRSV